MILYVLSGLPGAGKTTRALEIVQTSGAVFVCRDELRISYRVPIDEGHLTLAMAAQARFFLSLGYDVVVDSWNLTEWDEELWFTLAADCDAIVEWQHLNTPVEVCIERDAKRPLSIGSDCVMEAASAFASRLQILADD